MTALDSLLSRQPWLITTDAMQGMVAQAVAFFDARIQLPEPTRNALLSVVDGIGIIDLHGPLMRQPDLISSLLFGATDNSACCPYSPLRAVVDCCACSPPACCCVSCSSSSFAACCLASP